jgi:hypothetical protein
MHVAAWRPGNNFSGAGRWQSQTSVITSRPNRVQGRLLYRRESARRSADQSAERSQPEGYGNSVDSGIVTNAYEGHAIADGETCDAR